jgi:hypothetical protein
MFNYDLMNYAGHAAVGYGALLVYDVVVEGVNIQISYVMKDALVFGLSTIASTLASDVISGLIPYINEGSFGGMISIPLINGLVYMWLYDYMISEKYNNTREESKNFLVGAGLCLVTGYLQNPIMSLFGMRGY